MDPIQQPVDSSVPQRYHNFVKWVHRNGCKVDSRLRIPNVEMGTIGVSTKQYIPERTVIMAIPQKLIITMRRCYDSPELHNLFKNNNQLFDFEESEDAEFNILAVFLMYEKAKIIKGRREHPEQEFFSFWQPYLESVQSSETGMDWSPSDLEGFYPQVIEEIEFFKDEIQDLGVKVLNYLKKRKQFAGMKREELYDLFHWAYKFVMTRCFGYCVPGTSLIPLADLMNHSCESIDHELINLAKQKQYSGQRQPDDKGPQDENYTMLTGNADMTLVGGQPFPVKQNPEVISFIVTNKNMQVSDVKGLTRKEKQKIIQQIYQGLNVQKPYTSNFYESSDDQDNDTESEGEREREAEINFLTQQEKEQMAEFGEKLNQVGIVDYKTVKDTLDEVEQAQGKEDSKQEHVEQCATETTEATQRKAEQPNQVHELKETEEEEVMQIKQQMSQSIDKQIQKPSQVSTEQAISEEEAQKAKKYAELKELIKNKFDKYQADPNQKFRVMQVDQSEDSSQESEEEFPWFDDPQTYFTIITSRAMKPGESLYNCYGRRTNKFLLIWYGFTYPDNLYDSVSFRFYVNFSFQKQLNTLIFDHYFGGQGLIKGFKLDNGMTVMKNQISREFRLKRSALSKETLTFLRLFLMHQYKEHDLLKLFVTFPSSLDYEIFVLKYLTKLISHLRLRYPQETILGWKKKEQEGDYRAKFKRIFYEEQLSILNANEAMINSAIVLLSRLKEERELSVEQAVRECIDDVGMVRKLRNYIKQLEQNLAYIRMTP